MTATYCSDWAGGQAIVDRGKGGRLIRQRRVSRHHLLCHLSVAEDLLDVVLQKSLDTANFAEDNCLLAARPDLVELTQ